MLHNRELSELIVSMIPNKATAANIVRMCQAAILESSSLVRNRAMDIMRTIARLAFDSHDRAIHAGQAQNAGQTRQAQNAGQTRQAQNAGQTRQAQQTQQAAAATPEAEDSVPRQQMQETVDVAAGLARLLQSTAESQPSTPVGSMTDTGTGSAAEVGPGLPSDAVAAVQQLGETASSDLSQIAASPITDRSGNAASAAQQAAAALTERQQLADRATDELSAAIGSTPTATDASFSPGQDAAASVTTPTATDASSSPGQVAAAIGSTPTTADASFSLGQDAAASVTTALATDVPSSPGQDAAASVTTPTATNASPSPVQDAAAALAQRQQVAQQAIDDLFAEVDSSQAGDAGSAILAAAAGQSPLAAALRQHIVDQAMQELFGTDRSSSPRCGLSGSQALPAAADASAAAERYAAIHPALTATAAAATPSLAAARTAATPTGPALQRQPTAEQTGFQIRAFEGEEEVHLGGSYSSADSVASRQDALDQAIDELIFPDRTSSDSADSDGSQTGSLHSSSGSSHAAEGSTSESSSASSSSGEDSEQSGSEPAEYDRSVEETAATSAGHSRVRLHAPESLTAILRALQQRADTSASRSQAQGVPAAVQGASATAAPAVAAERNIRQPQSAAPNRPVRQRQGILGLPSLRLMPSTRTGQAPSVNSPAAAASSVAAVASPQHLGDAEMQRECRDMVRRMTEAVQDNDYHEGQNFLDFMPGITAEEAASHESIEDYIWRQDQTPRCLIAAENDREGSQWKTKVPGFYAVNSEYRRGHVMDVREQIFCRRQVGFHVKVGRKKRLRQVFRGVLGVAAAALAAGLVTKRVHWHGKDDSRVEVDETETESGTDSDDESEVIRLLWASDLTAQPQFI